MARIKLSPEQVEQILACVPEGFVRQVVFENSYRLRSRAGLDNDILFDATRLTLEQARELARWCNPSVPHVSAQGLVEGTPIRELREARIQQLQADVTGLALLERMPEIGYIAREALITAPDEVDVLERLISAKFLALQAQFIYDPLKLGTSTMNGVCRRANLRLVHQMLIEFLSEQPAWIAPMDALEKKFGNDLDNLILIGGVVKFSVPYASGHVSSWLRIADKDAEAATKRAKKVVRQQKLEVRHLYDEQWARMFASCGDVLRPDARDGKTNRMRVLARSYTVAKAAKRLGCSESTLEDAIRHQKITPFYDPDGHKRLSAQKIERAIADPEYEIQLTGLEKVKARQIALVSGVHYSTARSRLQREHLSTTQPTWAQVRGKWGLPDTLRPSKRS